MEGIVAKRTLKKSYYESNNKITNEYVGMQRRKKDKKSKGTIETFKNKILYKLAFQAITMTSILLFIILVKYLNIKVVLNSDAVKNINREINKNYSIKEIKEATNKVLNKGYLYIKPVVPSQVVEKIKQIINTLEIKENVIYEESNIINKENTVKENIGAAVDEQPQVISAVSSVSSEQDIATKINKTGIEFVKPLKGVITSSFGAREQIFEGVDSYHTGIDIAANQGKSVVSSTDGKVTKSTYNQYNGNFVEVTNGKIVTKYCHLSKLSVKVGSNIKSGDKVGEVGSTGLSTGPHLHFEIVYDGTKVDPSLIIDF